MFFIILCFILSLKVVFIHAEQHTWRQNIWAMAPILQGKLNMFNLPCKTVQVYPARLHASYCETLQRVGYLARCCTQYTARYLARNIASCRQAFRLISLNQFCLKVNRHLNKKDEQYYPTVFIFNITASSETQLNKVFRET